MKQNYENLIITGYSDDNLEFEGCIHDEVSCYDENPTVELPDGAKFQWQYNSIWEVKQIAVGNVYAVEIRKGDEVEDINDHLHITGKVPFVVVTVGDEIKVLGDPDMKPEMNKIYHQLALTFSDVPEFEERAGAVRAILSGYEIY